ncbi:hypothetical protein ABK040_001988 [Willaertia magna]
MSNIVLEDKFFDIKQIDPEGKKFDKVSRLYCESEDEIELVIDINTDIYPVDIGERLVVALATSLDPNKTSSSSNTTSTTTKKTKEKDYYDPYLGTEEKSSLLDKYDYVMYGRVYKYQPKDNFEKIAIYVSFGGLLMRLTGEARDIQHIEPDTHVYLLIRKS